MLQDYEFIYWLKYIVPLKPSYEVSCANKIPPHTHQSKKINNNISLCKGTQNGINILTRTITKSVDEVIDNKSLGTYNLTRETVEDPLQGANELIIGHIYHIKNSIPLAK